MGWEQTASGYAAVWATENTREAIFDAMQRRETYATTGPRMVVRFFGSFEFDAADASNRMPAQIGYTKGVPMGGDLTAAPSVKLPPSSSRHSKILSERISTESRSSRVGSTRKVTRRKKFMTWFGATPISGSRARMENCRLWEIRWTSKRRHGPTPSAIPN